jgi:hypothetical protein
MKTRTKILGAATFLTLATIALAHHIPVALSSSMGAEILREVVFLTDSSRFGVPPYVHGREEIHHHQPIALAEGDSIRIKHDGQFETIVFEAGDFADIQSAEIEEVLDVISAKSALIEAYDTNGFAVLRGTSGGELSALSMVDSRGSVLSQMHVQGGTQIGSDDLVLDVSTPGVVPGHQFADHRYLVLCSLSEGQFQLGGATVPLSYDALTQSGVTAALQGTLPGFFGRLDAGGDAVARLEGELLGNAFRASFPDKMHFAYVVFEPRSLRVAFVSNRFTVDFQ